MQSWKKYIFASDVVSLYLALVLALLARGAIHQNAIQDDSVWIAAHLFIFLPSVIFSVISLYIAGLYDAKIIYDRSKTIVLLFYAQFASAIFSVISFYVLKTELTPKLTLFFFVIISILILSITRGIIYTSISKQKKPKAIFLSERNNLLNNLNTHWAPYSLELIALRELGPLIKGPANEVTKLTPSKFQGGFLNGVSAVVYDEQLLNPSLILDLENLKQRNISTYSYNQYYEFLHKKVDLENIFIDDLMRELGERKETRAHFLVRRTLDILLALTIYPIYLLSLPFVYLGIYLQDKGEIYSKQSRIGLLGRPIWIWKIRTMTHTDQGGVLMDANKKVIENQSGNRYTKFGMFLRKSRIDELPQCINLLWGDVSFIGPRSLVLGVFNDIKNKIPNFALRLLAPQGLTGWAQVHMHYQPKTFEEELEKFAYDLYYIKHRSLFLDFSVILKTIKTVLSREGA
jgi:lipopolysaccharide/colanic/teichoic acid biosynthesis glycosyltransferase